MKENWVDEAVAEHEEYLKRVHGCQGHVSPQPHSYRPHGALPALGKSRRVWSECMICGVTETRADWYMKDGRSAA